MLIKIFYFLISFVCQSFFFHIFQDINYSIRDICVKCIQRFTGEAEGDIEDKMEVVSPNRDEISEQKIYPVPIGNDPERQACINKEMRDVHIHTVLALECKQIPISFIK